MPRSLYFACSSLAGLMMSVTRVCAKGTTRLHVTFERAISSAVMRVRPSRPGLGAAIARLAVISVKPGGRPDVDDAAPGVLFAARAGRPTNLGARGGFSSASGFGLVAHDRRRGADQIERCGQIGADDGIPIAGLAFEHQRVAQDGSVVDHDVEAAEFLDREIDRRLRRRRAGDALDESARACAQFLRKRPRGLRIGAFAVDARCRCRR